MLLAGRWKGVPVAIKVVDHTSEAGNCVDAARESVLSKSVQHPNVVRAVLAAAALTVAHSSSKLICRIRTSSGGPLAV